MIITITALGAPAGLITKINNDSIGGVFLYHTLPALYDKLGKKIKATSRPISMILTARRRRPFP